MDLTKLIVPAAVALLGVGEAAPSLDVPQLSPFANLSAVAILGWLVNRMWRDQAQDRRRSAQAMTRMAKALRSLERHCGMACQAQAADAPAIPAAPHPSDPLPSDRPQGGGPSPGAAPRASRP
jgi:hypothetical protein